MSRASLTSSQKEGYRHQLQAMVDRLRETVGALRKETLGPVGGVDNDELRGPAAQDTDVGINDTDAIRTLPILGSEEHILTEAQDALARLDEGTFGICEDCDKPIAKARLDALPYARRCVRCEQAAEQEGATEGNRIR